MEIDGVNQYDTIFKNAPSNRDEILLQLDPPAMYYGDYFIGQAAIRVRDWKLIIGTPNCSINTPDLIANGCPSGWIFPNGTMLVNILFSILH